MPMLLPLGWSFLLLESSTRWIYLLILNNLLWVAYCFLNIYIYNFMFLCTVADIEICVQSFGVEYCIF